MDAYSINDGILIPKTSPELWQRLKTAPIRPDDVIICTFPRSGTTWMQYIVKLLRNGGIDDGVSLDDAVPWIDVLGTELAQKMNYPVSAENIPSPRTLKSHLPYNFMPGGPPHTKTAKYIYIARNPKDVCVSWWYFNKSQIQKFTSEDLSLVPWDSFCTDFFEVKGMAGTFGGWLNHVLGWWEHHNESNVLFITYESMQKNPHKTVQAIAEFLEIKDNVQELIDTVVSKMTFSSMVGNPSVNARKKGDTAIGVVVLRKGIIGDWKNHFTKEQSEEYEEKIIKILKEHGLNFDYE